MFFVTPQSFETPLTILTNIPLFFLILKQPMEGSLLGAMAKAWAVQF